MAYDQAQIRKYVVKSFDDQEIRTFCFDYFPSVYEDLTDGMRKSRKVELLLSHCLRNNLMTDLVAALAREKPGPFVDEFLAQAPDELTEPVVISSSITRNPRQIFISHAHQDAELAHWLAEKLNLHGWQSWIAPESIRPGEKWVEAINRGLAESGVFVLVLTETAVQSRWVRSETNFAIQSEHEGKLKFIPLKTASYEIPATPPLWQTYQYVRFDVDLSVGLEVLLTELKSENVANDYELLDEVIQESFWSPMPNDPDEALLWLEELAAQEDQESEREIEDDQLDFFGELGVQGESKPLVDSYSTSGSLSDFVGERNVLEEMPEDPDEAMLWLEEITAQEDQESEREIESDQLLFMSAIQALANGDVEKALNNYKMLLENNNYLSNVIAALKIAVLAYPKIGRLHYLLGDAYIKNGQREKALESYRGGFLDNL